MEDELMKIWKSSSNQERVKFEKSRLMLEVQSSIDRLDRIIKYRDMREMIAVAIVIPAFVFQAFKTPFILSKIACVFIILFAIYVVIQLRKAKRHRPGRLTETYLEYLHKTKEYLNVQKQLLDTALYWYILPGYIGISLFTLGTGKLPYIIKMQVLSVAFGILAYFLNKRAVNKTLLPRLQKIDELIKVMETP